MARPTHPGDSPQAAEIAARFRTLAEPILSDLGLELVDAEFRRETHGWVLRLYMDRAGGVTLDDCQRVSEQVGALLDVEDPLPGAYVLEVSSPGLDRPLRKAADFARFAGQKVDVRMRLADANGRRRYIGRLMGIEGVTATVEVDGAPVALPLDGMDRARLVPEL